jgi:hypothetical protein
MESGDIEVVVRQALKHINTDIIENTKLVIETKIQRV